MKLHNITDKLLIASVAIIIFATGFRLGQNNATFTPTNFSVTNLEERNTKNLDFSLFWETWNKLTERYVNQDALDPQAMFYGAIKGVVSSVGDPYTFFLTPKENKQSKDDLSGKFEGIGAQLGLKNGNIVIIAPLRNSPAGEAGVRSGDIILKVDNKSTEGWSLQKAV
ncbi:MAG: S41 family peptidase, partial [Candidatus Paceibacterota bacterium]